MSRDEMDFLQAQSRAILAPRPLGTTSSVSSLGKKVIMVVVSRRVFAAASAGLALSLGSVSARQADSKEPDSGFSAFWDALVESVPNDPEGEEAFLSIAGAGGLTSITADQQSAAVAYLKRWTGAIQAIEPDVIPAHAAKFHEDVIYEIESLASLIEYSDVADLADMMSFSQLGIYVLLLGERDARTE
jgi:hypothetical protein